MPQSLAHRPAPCHRVITEMRPRMAKADLPKPEIDTWRERIGRAIQRALSLRGWSLKEFAAAVGRDERQVGRWINGQERAQFDAIFAVDTLRAPVLQALAELARVRVRTTIEFSEQVSA